MSDQLPVGERKTPIKLGIGSSLFGGAVTVAVDLGPDALAVLREEAISKLASSYPAWSGDLDELRLLAVDEDRMKEWAKRLADSHEAVLAIASLYRAERHARGECGCEPEGEGS